MNMPDEDDANLIAAAPELLEALEDVVSLAQSAMRLAALSTDGYELDHKGDYIDLKEAKAAIAKAKGE